VALVAFGGIFAYQYFSTPKENNQQQIEDQTTSWKTYTNSEYGFEFKYPADFKEIDKVKNSNLLYYFRLGKSEKYKDYNIISSLMSPFDPKQLPSISEKIRVYKPSEIVFNGIKSYKLEWISCEEGCGSGLEIYIPYAGGAITISVEGGKVFRNEQGYVVEDSESANIKSTLFDRILSTFKFIP